MYCMVCGWNGWAIYRLKHTGKDKGEKKTEPKKNLRGKKAHRRRCLSMYCMMRIPDVNQAPLGHMGIHKGPITHGSECTPSTASPVYTNQGVCCSLHVS